MGGSMACTKYEFLLCKLYHCNFSSLSAKLASYFSTTTGDALSILFYGRTLWKAHDKGKHKIFTVATPTVQDPDCRQTSD